MAAVLLAAVAASAEEPDPGQTRAIMGELFAALQQALPPSLDERRFADPAHRAEIRQALATLSRNAGRLAEHGSRGGAGFAFLSGSLAREAREIERRYAAGRFRDAQLGLHDFTENCVACHSRLPAAADADLSSRFMQQAEIDALPLFERARLAMATRQYEQAMAAQEAMLASPEFDAGSLDLGDCLDDYLRVCIRVRGDFERPARALEGFAKRPDLKGGLRRDVRRWIADLRVLGTRGRVEGLEAARRLVEEAEAEAKAEGPRAPLIRYHAASGALHRLVASLPEGDPRTAEADYWLGLIEARVGRSVWISQTEPYLEAAIRLAPADPVAQKAYAELQQFVASAYGDYGGHAPHEVKAWLEELSKLIAASRAGEKQP